MPSAYNIVTILIEFHVESDGIVSTCLLCQSSAYKCDNKIADANADKGCDKARELERVVEYIFADTRCAGSVEVDSSHLRRIVWNEEITIHGRKHSHECQWRDAQTDTQREEG